MCLTDLKKLRTDKEDIQDLYVDYLSQYRSCLAETDIAKLDSMWCTLDEKWMKITYSIQLVHDIEYASLATSAAIDSLQAHHISLSLNMPPHACARCSLQVWMLPIQQPLDCIVLRTQQA